MAYSAHYLAKFGTLILQAPFQTLKSVFQEDFQFQGDADNYDELLATVRRQLWTQPYRSTIALCERIVPMLDSSKIAIKAAHPNTTPSIIAFTLCLLIRFRLACKSWLYENDDVIATATFIAYKFLTDWNVTRLNHWAVPVGMSGRLLGRIERDILCVLDHKVWIRNSVYEQYVGRMEMMWHDALEKESMPSPRSRPYLYQSALR